MTFEEWEVARVILEKNIGKPKGVVLAGGERIRCDELLLVDMDKIRMGNRGPTQFPVIELRKVMGLEAGPVTMRLALSSVIGIYVINDAN